LIALLCFGRQPSAQSSLTFSLFERYLGALREQAGIPGLAAAIVQDGNIIWSRGFGVASTASSAPIFETTPFFVADLSETAGAALVLRECIETGEVQLDDVVERWAPGFPDRTATFRQVLSHSSARGYSFNRARFEALTEAVEECTDRPYPVTMVDGVLDRFKMEYAVPGGDVTINGSRVRQVIPTPKLNTYREVLRSMAVPHRVDANRRATPIENYTAPTLTAANGLVASISDLARFDAALDAGAIVRRHTLDEFAWVRQGTSQMGLGWFVQEVNRRKVVWHFGDEPGVSSSLLIKLPNQRLTLILLANSDGLSASFPLKNGDVTVSPFAQIFFTLLG
jgi:CubicO group peptidase (beta-lactamase class C family)